MEEIKQEVCDPLKNILARVKPFSRRRERIDKVEEKYQAMRVGDRKKINEILDKYMCLINDSGFYSKYSYSVEDLQDAEEDLLSDYPDAYKRLIVTHRKRIEILKNILRKEIDTLNTFEKKLKKRLEM